MVVPPDSDPSRPGRPNRPRRSAPPRRRDANPTPAAPASVAAPIAAAAVLGAPVAAVLGAPVAAVPPPDPTNGAYAPGETIGQTPTPVYVAGYRIPGDKKHWFLAANVSFVVVLVILTIFFIPMGIPFLAVKKAEGFLGYIGFFFTYMFGYFAFLMLMLFTLGAGGYAVQQRYFA